MLDELKVSGELVLAPASHVAPHTSPVTELVAELVPAGGQAGRVDVAVVQVDPLAQSQHGQVVTETFPVEPGVDGGTEDVVLLVLVLLRPLVGAGVVLTNPHLQTPRTPNIVQVVGGSQHLGGPPRVVVVEVLRDDGAGSNEVVVGVEDETGPGKLSRRGLSVPDTRGWPGVGPLPTLVLAEHLALCTSLAPSPSTTVTSASETTGLSRALRSPHVRGAAQLLTGGAARWPRVTGAGARAGSVNNPLVYESLAHQIIRPGQLTETTLELSDTAALAGLVTSGAPFSPSGGNILAGRQSVRSGLVGFTEFNKTQG